MSSGIAAPIGLKTGSTVSIRVMRALFEAVGQVGGPRLELLRATGLDADQLDDADARLPFGEIFRICELALDLTRDPALALHWGERLTSNSFVPVSHLISHAASLRQGFASLSQFERLLTDEPAFQLLEHGSQATLRCSLSLGSESARIQRFAAEMMLTGFFRLLRSFSPLARLARVSFIHPAPDYRAEYERIFEQPVYFEQPLNEFVFERVQLNAPSPYKDDDVHEALQTLAQDRIARLTQSTSYALRVRDFLVKQGWPKRTDMESVARGLGLSVRSLRRRLAAENKSYYDLENDALGIVARHFLRDRQLSIQETAYEMGFADTTAFHRAFKRWTGTTPSACQKK